MSCISCLLISFRFLYYVILCRWSHSWIGSCDSLLLSCGAWLGLWLKNAYNTQTTEECLQQNETCAFKNIQWECVWLNGTNQDTQLMNREVEHKPKKTIGKIPQCCTSMYKGFAPLGKPQPTKFMHKPHPNKVMHKMPKKFTENVGMTQINS